MDSEGAVFHPAGTLIQFTGLKDIKGKEIYEGDIIKHHDHEYPYPRAAVTWNEKTGAFQVGIGLMSEHDDWLEVIGNIYENPDLLKD